MAPGAPWERAGQVGQRAWVQIPPGAFISIFADYSTYLCIKTVLEARVGYEKHIEWISCLSGRNIGDVSSEWSSCIAFISKF